MTLLRPLDWCHWFACPIFIYVFAQVMVCARLDLIYRQGDIAQNVYFVKEGHLRFVLSTDALFNFDAYADIDIVNKVLRFFDPHFNFCRFCHRSSCQLNTNNDPGSASRAASRVKDSSQVGWTKNHWKIADSNGSKNGNNKAVLVQDYLGGSHFGHGERYFLERTSAICYRVTLSTVACDYVMQMQYVLSTLLVSSWKHISSTSLVPRTIVATADATRRTRLQWSDAGR